MLVYLASFLSYFTFLKKLSYFICILSSFSFSLILFFYFNFSIILGCSRPGRAAGYPGSPSPSVPASGGWAPLVHGWVWGCIDPPLSIPPPQFIVTGDISEQQAALPLARSPAMMSFLPNPGVQSTFSPPPPSPAPGTNRCIPEGWGEQGDTPQKEVYRGGGTDLQVRPQRWDRFSDSDG